MAPSAANPASAEANSAHGTLVLIPTGLEHVRFLDQGGLPPELGDVEVCGFGVAASGARAAQLVTLRRPARVFLLGIAGAYDTERHPPGTALVFERVAIDGIGAGEGTRFQGPHALGFPQWPGSPDTMPTPVLDELPLWVPAGVDAAERAPLILTTCAASDSPAHAAERQTRHPPAAAEDMEGFAVAIACALGSAPLCIVRGISNQVGDRDARNWRIPAALAAARKTLLALVAGP